MTSTPRRDPLVGETVDGRYAALERVARGGMSTVYRALDLRLDREVALKVMHPHLAEDPALVGRFEREAKTAARLSHPHVVAVLDQGHTTLADGQVLAYLVMEYVPGRTLRDVVRAEAPTTPRRALALLRPVVDGLAAAHRAGLVHRDVKPENVLVREDGRVTVADFGLSRAATGHTSVGQAVLGTPAYLAPELITGDVADARADVYAVGILLFELLTGRQPFPAATAIQVAYRHVNERVPVPSTLVPGLAESLDDLVLWCTEPDPQDRPDDAGALLAELGRVSARLTPAELDHAPAAPGLAETTALPPAAADHVPPPRHAVDPAADPDDDGLAPDDDATRVLTAVARETAPVPEAGVHPAPGSAHAASPAPSAAAPRRPSRSSARRPTADLGAGVTRTVAIGAAVTLLLTGAALLLGWTLGTGGLGTAGAVVVPSVRGLAQEEARARLDAVGLTAAVTVRHDERYSDGTVVATTPAAGDSLRRDTPVELTVSDGPAPVPVPELTGQTVGEAHASAEDGRLGVVVDGRRTDRAVESGRVLTQTPAPGESTAPGGDVHVVLSSGPARHAVPDLTGLTLPEARACLAGLGLEADVRDAPAPLALDAPVTVVRQGTPAGTELPEGAVVQLRVR